MASAYAEADPNGDHLKTMQDVFRRVLAGESIFRSEDDWSAYTKGSNEENARWNPHGVVHLARGVYEEHQRGLGLDPCGNLNHHGVARHPADAGR